MVDTTLTSKSGVNVLSLHQPAEYFGKVSQQNKVVGSTGSRSEPSDFFTPSSLTNRASDLYRLQDSTSSSIQAIQKAQAGIARIQELVSEAEGIARDAGALEVETASVSSTVTGLTGGETLEGAFNIDSGDSITVGDGLHSITVTADGSTTLDSLVSEINSDENLDVKASVYQGALKLEANSENDITVALTDNGGGANSLSDLGFADLGEDVVAEAGTLSLNRLGLANDFNAILEEIDAVAKDSGFEGINLLQGSSVSEKFSSDEGLTVSVDGVDFDSDGLGLTQADNRFQTSVDVLSSIAELDAAAVNISNQAAIYESNEAVINVNQGFSAGLISTLQSGTDLDVSAPVDDVVGRLAEETKKLLATESKSLTSSDGQDLLKSLD
ncbi:MAG: flagellin hook IN motif-containing protein [Methyloligellaceae bacterium]